MVVVLIFAVTACKGESESLLYDYSLSDNIFKTECVTNHQGEHEINKCNVYIDGDTLEILFPTQLPAYWGWIEVKIFDGKLNALFDGVPFVGPSLKYETVKQRLTLDQRQYSLNDTLYGYCDFIFNEIDPITGQAFTFYFKGAIREVIREKTFDPFNPEHFMGFNLPTALHELGEPLNREIFYLDNLPGEFRVVLLNFFSPDKNIKIEELTWSIGEDAQISDESTERLTIWYARAADKENVRKNPYLKLPEIWESTDDDSSRQLPVTFEKWDCSTQF